MTWCLFYFTEPVLLRLHRLRQVARPLFSSGVTFGEPSWWLRRPRIEFGRPLVVTLRRRFRQVARPSSNLYCHVR
jgi:hypothetical protein